MDNTTLYFRQGPSDKIYQAIIHPKDDGYMVHFAYGRRGSTLNTGTKTQAPVTYAVAKTVFDNLIKEKMAKGYTQGIDAPVPVHIDQKKHSGINCQLLNPVSEDNLDSLLSGRDHWMQEKMDGRRLLLNNEGRTLTGINRLGFTVAIPQTIADSAARYKGDFLIDGEAVGDTLHVFDLLSIRGKDVRSTPFHERHWRLEDWLRTFKHPHITPVRTHSYPEKTDWFHRYKKMGREGVVFKDIHAPYCSGRPNAGGSQLKFKFYETASFIVTKLNAKRSVSLILFDGDKVRGAGNVTIPPNHDIPAPGTVVECRYLYAFRESGAIYQPVFLGPREDILADECTTAQLKYKAEVLETAA